MVMDRGAVEGMDPRTVRRSRARYQAGERLALYDRRHGPSPRKAPALEVARILRLSRLVGLSYTPRNDTRVTVSRIEPRQRSAFR
jgi:hypothetical protein